MSKFKNYIKDWAMSEILANLIDPDQKTALDWVRVIYVVKDRNNDPYEVVIPKGRAIPLSRFKKWCTQDTILDYSVDEITLDNSGQLTINLWSEEIDEV